MFAERAAGSAGGEDDEDNDSSSNEQEEDDELSTAGGLDELLNRANLELGGAVRTERTGQTGPDAGNCFFYYFFFFGMFSFCFFDANRIGPI